MHLKEIIHNRKGIIPQKQSNIWVQGEEFCVDYNSLWVYHPN